VTGSLPDQSVLVIGRGRGIARAMTLAAHDVTVGTMAVAITNRAVDVLARSLPRNRLRSASTPGLTMMPLAQAAAAGVISIRSGVQRPSFRGG
jgi:hypothetical protein